MKATLQIAPLLLSCVSAASLPSLPVRLETRSELDSRLANVHVAFNEPVDGALTYTYGPCASERQDDAHHTVGRSTGGTTAASRLVWRVPTNVRSGDCLAAWDGRGALVGRSGPQQFRVRKRDLRKRDGGITMSQATGFDTWGPWFDGVALLEGKHASAVDTAAAKAKAVGIVGAGMSGLMTYLVLHQAGLANITLLEGGQRLGGRVHTEYLSGGPFDYSYQEMGPMRFPHQITVRNETYNVTDHQLVFQLAAELNTLNGGDANFSVDFIPWLQSSPNGLSYTGGFKLPDTGLPPTLAQIKANASLVPPTAPLDPSTQRLQDKIDALTNDEDFMIQVATNMHKAHSDFLHYDLGGKGGDSWSEYGFMVNYLNATLNDTDIVTAGDGATSFWNTLYDNVYFGANSWKTIDGGLSRLPQAFHPLVDNVTHMDTHVDGAEWLADEARVRLSWKDATTREARNATFDYAVVAMPFSKVKRWRLAAQLPKTMGDAITNLPMGGACKVALEYDTRFWEQLANPIYGGCSTTTDIPGIGTICYPSYNLNGTGPATLLASYASGDWATRWLAVSEEEHVQYVVDAMNEIHGPAAAAAYTGKYNRRCWYLDPLESGSWAEPTAGQHALYLPEYFKTYDGMIFVGEQTSYTHAWIASALESGVRGAVQLLLELGLVDEAKAAVDKWMARWIDV